MTPTDKDLQRLTNQSNSERLESRVLLRDDEAKPLAVSCRGCGGFCLDTDTKLCAGCKMTALCQQTRGRA